MIWSNGSFEDDLIVRSFFLLLLHQFQTELRKILVSLIEVAQKLLALNPDAVELFKKANGKAHLGTTVDLRGSFTIPFRLAISRSVICPLVAFSSCYGF